MVQDDATIDSPQNQDAPVALEPRWKHPITGIVSFIFTFFIALLAWRLIAFSPYAGVVSLFGGFGILAILYSIWFETWPFSRLRTPWMVGLTATIFNAIAVVMFYLVANWFSEAYASFIDITDPMATYVVGWAVFGSLSASCFSFAILWAGSSQYWPVFDKKQPIRGLFVFSEGLIITLIVWVLLFFHTGNSAADPLVPSTWTVQPYDFNMAWTQWTIFLTLLTLLTFEYWPWKKAGKQPIIGAAAFITVPILSFLSSYMFFYIAQSVLLPAVVSMGYTVSSGFEVFSAGVMNSAFAICLIAAVIMVSKFLDNWPKGYSQTINFLARLVMVIILGVMIFFFYYLISPLLLGLPVDLSLNNATSFLLLFLWIELLFAYLWRQWPLYMTVE